MDGFVSKEVRLEGTLVSEEVGREGNLILKGVVRLDGMFMDGTGDPPRAIQLVMRIGKLFIGISDRYQINPSLGITHPNIHNWKELNLTAIS